VSATANTSRPGTVIRNARRMIASLLQPQMSSAARERRDLFVLLAAVAFVTAPHLEDLPWWAIGVLVALWSCRVWLTAAQKPLPRRRWLWPLLLVTGIAVYLEHRTWFGAGAGVLLLLLLMGLKLLEMRARRDILVVIFLCFFILLTLFLQGQALGIAFIALAAVLLLFFVLTSVNLADVDLPARSKARLVFVVFLKAIPLTVVFFLLFPRLSGPLWGSPGAEGAGRTGLSNSMSPGSLGRLLESDAIAFRARFRGVTPANGMLYWRGPTFGFFNGRTWTARTPRAASAQPSLQVDTRSMVEYSVTLEPHSRDWIFALEMPQLPERVGDLAVRAHPDGQLIANGLVTQRVRYEMRSFTRYAFGRGETRDTLRDWLQLPSNFNPRTLQYTADLRRRTPGADTRAGDPALIDAVLQLFRNGGFSYTLAPRSLGRHSVDDFLFDTREGFCEHYSSAFVTLMRALDIPARVVTGYQGGELNPVDGFVTVRQSDAHAWAEVWLDGRGWVRIDPTAAVAPDRVELGAARLARESAAAGALGNVAAFNWLRSAIFSMRFNWEALQNAWNQWVLAYSPERQRALLSRLGLDPDWRTLGQLLAVSLSMVLAVLAWLSLKHRVERDPLGEAYVRLRARLAAAGVATSASDGPRALASAVAALDEPQRGAAAQLLGEFERLRYARDSAAAGRREVAAFVRSVARFRPRRTAKQAS
jgi:transglutaminase-like putative cysteine protease